MKMGMSIPPDAMCQRLRYFRPIPGPHPRYALGTELRVRLPPPRTNGKSPPFGGPLNLGGGGSRTSSRARPARSFQSAYAPFGPSLGLTLAMRSGRSFGFDSRRAGKAKGPARMAGPFTFFGGGGSRTRVLIREAGASTGLAACRIVGGRLATPRAAAPYPG